MRHLVAAGDQNRMREHFLAVAAPNAGGIALADDDRVCDVRDLEVAEVRTESDDIILERRPVDVEAAVAQEVALMDIVADIPAEGAVEDNPVLVDDVGGVKVVNGYAQHAYTHVL